VPRVSSGDTPGKPTTVTLALDCAHCQGPLHLSYEFQGRERKNVYKCPHCSQMVQIDLPGLIVLPVPKA
jgi:hypothetical protein